LEGRVRVIEHGDHVIVYPSDAIRDSVRVQGR